MSIDLRDALSRASDEGRTNFELRDATEVINPASERVRRQRAGIATVATLGITVLAGCALWGLSALGANRHDSMDPADSNSPPPNATELLSETPWSTLSLAAGAEPRAQGEKRVDSVAGMICHHAQPQDDPRVVRQSDITPAVSGSTNIEDCEPVWFKNGPFTSDANASVSTGTMPAGISSQALITNDSGRPIAIDTESVFMWVETEPDQATDDGLSSYADTIIGPSMWSSVGDNTALLRSDTETTLIPIGGHFSARASATAYGSEGGPLADVAGSEASFTVTFWARIHEDKPSGDATYLIQLGGPQRFDLTAVS